jgi:DNA polymerase III alpha subunit
MVDWKKSRNEDYPTRNTWKSPRIRGKIEQNLLGISLSYDPLFDNKEWIEKQGVASLGELQKADVGDFVCIPGQVTSIRKHQAKNGEMAWLTVKLLSHDEVTLTMFATAWSKYKDLISTNVIAAFNCKRTDDWNGKQSYVAFSAKANLEGEE